jgi:hypothetical protein
MLGRAAAAVNDPCRRPASRRVRSRQKKPVGAGRVTLPASSFFRPPPLGASRPRSKREVHVHRVVREDHLPIRRAVEEAGGEEGVEVAVDALDVATDPSGNWGHVLF